MLNRDKNGGLPRKLEQPPFKNNLITGNDLGNSRGIVLQLEVL